MNLNSYEAKVLGRDLYVSIAKRYNLTTKKWTLGRLKGFKEEIKYYMDMRLKKRKRKKK